MIHTINLTGYSAIPVDCRALILGTAKSYGIEQLQIITDDTWAGLAITATFVTATSAVKMLVDPDGAVKVPHEATANPTNAIPGRVVFAGVADGVQRISCDLPYRVMAHAPIDGAGSHPTPSEFQQFVTAVKEDADRADRAATRASLHAASAEDSAKKALGAVAGIDTATANALQKLEESKSQAEKSISTMGEDNVRKVSDEGNSAIDRISSAKETGLEEVNRAKQTATAAVGTARTQAVKAVQDEGNTQVKRVNEVFPAVTPADNGKMPVVKDGKWSVELPPDTGAIDDEAISKDTTWSSKKTVDALCSPFNQKAAVVHGELVADYPMSVKSYIEPVQEGSGDPSPENKRPIHGVTKLTAYKCGKNLINLPSYTAKVYNSVLPRAEYEALYASLEALPSGQYRTSGSLSVQLRIDYQGGGNVTFRSNSQSGEVKQGKISTVRLYVGAYGDSFPQTVTNVQLEVGSTPTPYEPYSGETYSQPLPEEVFGGVYNWDTGELTKTAYPFKITNSNRLLCWGVNKTTPGVTGFYVFFRDLLGGQIPPWLIASDALPVACDWLIPDKYDAILGKKANKCTISVGGDNSYIAISVANELIGVSAETSADAAIEVMKQYLSAHPLTVIAKCSPILVSTLDKATILAQSGTTTVYSNSGDTEVTARKDPAAERKTLEERLAALEKAAAQF